MTWTEVRGRYLFREVNERGYDLPLASVTRHGGVEFRSDLDIEVWNPSSNTSQYKRAKPGDFVIGLRSFQSGIGYSTLEGLVSPAYTVLRAVSSDVYGPFFKHLFKSDIYVSRLENVAQGIRQGRTISTEDFYNIAIAVPSVAEQRAIADYLDTETSCIDTLITKKRRMIELLEERQRTVITRTLRSTRHHGERRPLRAYAEVHLGRQRSPRHDQGPHMTPYLRAANVKDGVLVLSDIKSMNFDPVEQNRFALIKGDVLVSEGSGSLTAVGASAVWNGEIKGTICFQNTLLRLRPRPSTDPRFLAWWCRYAHADGLFANIATGANIHHISADRVRSIPMNHVPLVEQVSIVEHLNTETSLIATTLAQQQRMLDLLSERRQALITSAVTGEFAVPLDRS